MHLGHSPCTQKRTRWQQAGLCLADHLAYFAYFKLFSLRNRFASPIFLPDSRLCRPKTMLSFDFKRHTFDRLDVFPTD